MKIKKVENTLFETKYAELENALSSIREDEMIELNVEQDDVKRWRTTVSNKAKKLGIEITTKYEEGTLYVKVINNKRRDVNKAIAILSNYPEFKEIIEMLLRD